jgi:hypothetical protein
LVVVETGGSVHLASDSGFFLVANAAAQSGLHRSRQTAKESAANVEESSAEFG